MFGPSRQYAQLVCNKCIKLANGDKKDERDDTNCDILYDVDNGDYDELQVESIWQIVMLIVQFGLASFLSTPSALRIMTEVDDLDGAGWCFEIP